MSIVAQYILPVAVIVSAAATSTTAAFAWRLYKLSNTHDRALFGDESLDGHDGIIKTVNRNAEMTNAHRRALRESDRICPDQYDLSPRERVDE